MSCPEKGCSSLCRTGCVGTVVYPYPVPGSDGLEAAREPGGFNGPGIYFCRDVPLFSCRKLYRPGSQGGTVAVVGPSDDRAVQALVRVDPGGFAARELAERVMIERGLDPTDTALRNSVVLSAVTAFAGAVLGGILAYAVSTAAGSSVTRKSTAVNNVLRIFMASPVMMEWFPVWIPPPAP